MNQLSFNGVGSAHALFPYKIVVVFIWEGGSWLLEESVLVDVSYTPLARLLWFSCARNPIPLLFQTPATQATNSVALISVFTSQIFYFYGVDKIKCSYNSDSVELVKSRIKCLETKGKFCALSPAINTENSLTYQKVSANLLRPWLHGVGDPGLVG